MNKYLSAALLTIGTICRLHAQPGEPISRHHIPASALHQLDSLYRHLDETGLYSGNILVAEGGRKVSAAAIGYSNMRTMTPMKETSAFNLASVSKQFTAAGILRLVAAGKLTLDQKIATVLQGFPYAEVTVRQLLNHTGGLPDYHEMMEKHWDKSKIATNADVIRMFKVQHPEAAFAPGTRFAYSNSGYVVLGAVIEAVSGKSFANYMQEEVFKPFGLRSTFVYTPRYAPRPVKDYALSYVKNEAGSYVEPDSIASLDFVRFLDGVCGQGRVTSTAADLLTWNNAVRDQKVLPKALWKEATTAPVIDGKSTDYGFGLEVVQSPERGRVLRHTGSWPAYIINNVLYLDKDVSLIFLTNKEQNSDVYQATFDAVKNIVFGKPFSFPEPLVQKAVAVDSRIYSKYVGTYVMQEMKDFELSISTRDGQLYATATGQPETVLKPESETMFFIPDLPIKVEFKAEGGNVATTLILHQDGQHEFKRK